MNNTLEVIPLHELAPSPTNPRKTFDPVQLQELANSIASKGIIQPLVVRLHQNGGPAMYEIVAGERRFRAATIAGVGEVPCIVRELDDVSVLEIQTIENLQRDDVHPLEEAEGYAALMKAAGYDVEQIAGKIGRSTKYVYDRVKLLKLIAAARKVFIEGEISAGHAILLARLNKDDQERLLDDGDLGNAYRIKSIWVHEHSDPGLDLDDVVRRKAISVRELDHLINETVRFRPDEVDLPNLFPETAAVLAAAQEEELKVVKITRSYRVTDEARDEKERTYGEQSWKRADGVPEEGRYGKAKTSKPCDHSVLGVVVAGDGRGEAFRVCVAKKKCKVHWATEQKDAEKRATRTSSTSASDAQQRDRYAEQRRREEAENARWKKARPQLHKALIEAITSATPLELLNLLIDKDGKARAHKEMPRGSTLEEAVRFLAYEEFAYAVTNEWNLQFGAARALKPFGLDAKKIVDEVAPPAPKPKAEKKPKAKPAPRKKGARGKKVQTAAKA